MMMMMTARLNMLQRRSNHGIGKLVVAAAVVAAAASIAVFPATATAGYVGLYQPAQVQCDRMTNRVDITPSIQIGNSYNRQRVAYQLAIRWISGTWLSTPNYTHWFVLDHNALQWTQVFSMYGTTGQWTYSPQVPVPTYTYRLDDGNYSVSTRYAWEAPYNSGNWYDVNGARVYSSSPWIQTQTQSYTNLGDWQPGTFCKV